MGDNSAHPSFLSTHPALSSHAPFGAGTPSQLTPNTRSEAEAALSANSTQQTDSAAPTTPAPTSSSAAAHIPSTDSDSALDAARAAYRRPPNPIRTSTSNYAAALVAATTSPTSAASPVSPLASASASAAAAAAATVLPASPLPVDAAHGVVPLTGIGAGQAEAIRRAQPTGLGLGRLGRQQSWSEQDMKHVYSQRLMVPDSGIAEDAGYSSAGPGEGER
ncbi:uncharacterized protein K441DRAFT_652059 [Cenococcum geophilum 1.58]|uniref:uncharacterized protein n=1 Tax=Cenococcum geophilum 1.58 TaxID=794803 RepID=UPI00358F910C|nr:hypothetical protein K441DRAFT_652059 [Cenococcum geophilum 1.58]